MGIQRVGHVVLKMRDLEEAKRFYGDVLGMTISSESPVAVFFRFGEYHHDIGVFKTADDAELPKEVQVGLLHVALVVDSKQALKEIHQRVTDHGVKVEAVFDHGFTKSIYVYDPNGNAIEIYAEAPDYDWRENNDFIGYLVPSDIETLTA